MLINFCKNKKKKIISKKQFLWNHFAESAKWSTFAKRLFLKGFRPFNLLHMRELLLKIIHLYRQSVLY